jgi:hypothetical protein
VCYHHHPFFGHEVEVIRTLRREADATVIVKLEDGLRLAIPCWMLDPVHCASLPEKPTPIISVRALCELRNLIDLQCLPAREPVDSSCSSDQKGIDDEQGHSHPDSTGEA